jgi:hypothetical protein
MFKLKKRKHHQEDIDPWFRLKTRAKASLPLKQGNTWRAKNVLDELHRTHNNSNPRKTSKKRPSQGHKAGIFRKLPEPFQKVLDSLEQKYGYAI